MITTRAELVAILATDPVPAVLRDAGCAGLAAGDLADAILTAAGHRAAELLAEDRRDRAAGRHRRDDTG